MVLGKLAMWHFPVTTLGPGDRLGIWFQGCDKNCKGCETPEFRRIVPLSDCREELDGIFDFVRNNKVDGLTISGGEPFLQPDVLWYVGRRFREIQLDKGIKPDIRVYTGRLYEELVKSAQYRKILQEITVLIDGPYIKELDMGSPIKGSENQRVLILDKTIDEPFRTDARRSGEIVWNDYVGRFVYIGLKQKERS